MFKIKDMKNFLFLTVLIFLSSCGTFRGLALKWKYRKDYHVTKERIAGMSPSKGTHTISLESSKTYAPKNINDSKDNPDLVIIHNENENLPGITAVQENATSVDENPSDRITKRKDPVRQQRDKDPHPGNTWAWISFTFALLPLLLMCVYFPVSLLLYIFCAPLSIIAGLIARDKEASNVQLANAGIVISLIAFLAGIMLFMLYVVINSI